MFKQIKVGTADDLASDQNLYNPTNDANDGGNEGDTNTCHWCGRVINVVMSTNGSNNYCSIECYNKEN